MVVKEKKYDSSVAESIQASAGFVNSVKNPLFVILLIFMIGAGYLIQTIGTKLVGMLVDIKVAIVAQNDLVSKQNNILDIMSKRH